jgi:hypothetical protein
MKNAAGKEEEACEAKTLLAGLWEESRGRFQFANETEMHLLSILVLLN